MMGRKMPILPEQKTKLQICSIEFSKESQFNHTEHAIHKEYTIKLLQIRYHL